MKPDGFSPLKWVCWDSAVFLVIICSSDHKDPDVRWSQWVRCFISYSTFLVFLIFTSLVAHDDPWFAFKALNVLFAWMHLGASALWAQVILMVPKTRLKLRGDQTFCVAIPKHLAGLFTVKLYKSSFLLLLKPLYWFCVHRNDIPFKWVVIIMSTFKYSTLRGFAYFDGS